SDDATFANSHSHLDDRARCDPGVRLHDDRFAQEWKTPARVIVRSATKISALGDDRIITELDQRRIINFCAVGDRYDFARLQIPRLPNDCCGINSHARTDLRAINLEQQAAPGVKWAWTRPEQQ